MNTIEHNVPLIKQGIQECVQSSAAALLQYFGKEKTLDAVKAEVPVYITDDGTKLGTSLGHIATYFIEQGFQTTLHTTDIQIFDRSWRDLSNQELLGALKERRKHIKHPVYDDRAFDLIFDGYYQFLNKGGHITFPILDEQYLIEILKNGPFFAVVSYNFLNQTSKYSFKNEVLVHDAISGTPQTHAVIVAGYKDGKFLIMDPDFEFGGKRWVKSELLIGALYLAQTDYDSLLISIDRSKNTAK